MSEKSNYTFCTLSDFMKIDFPPQNWLLYPFIREKGLSMLCAKPGIGKTFHALNIALTISTGVTFLNYRVDKIGKVLYIDGEMSAKDIQGRLNKLAKGLNVSLSNENIILLTPDMQDDPMPNLLVPKGQAEIDKFLKTNTVDLIVIDNLSMLCNGIRENNPEDWAPMQKWLLSLRRRNISVLIIDHEGKNTVGARGTSKKQDALDSIITLKRPEGYRLSEGACFEVSFEKSRGIYGKDIEPYEARLITNDDGGLCWATSSITSSKIENQNSQITKAAELYKKGKTVRQIADIMNIGKTKAANLVNESKKQDDELDDLPY